MTHFPILFLSRVRHTQAMHLFRDLSGTEVRIYLWPFHPSMNVLCVSAIIKDMDTSTL